MNFYKIVGTIAVVILIIALAIIGTTLADSNKNLKYPPTISDCPDSYVKDLETNLCIAINDVADEDKCGSEDFTTSDYSYPGIGRSSGMCAKKLWAKECMVDWDGITNNTDICYSTNK